MKFRDKLPTLWKLATIQLAKNLSTKVIVFKILVTKEDLFASCLDKQRVREAIMKHTQGTKFVRHEDCSRPYGDDCGYCEFCLQRQSELQIKIFEELGLEDEEE